MSLLAHKERVITGFCLLVFMLVAAVTGGWLFRGVIALIAAIGLYEFYSFFWPSKSEIALKAIGIALGAGIIIAQGLSVLWIGGFLCLAIVLVGFIFLFSFSKTQNCQLTDFSPLILGLVYIPLILHLSLYLSLLEQFLILSATVATDIGGFYAGNKYGKHKVWPTISPKKSIEGSLGGLLFCTLLCVCLGYVSSLESVRLISLPVYPLYEVQGAPLLPLWGWAIVGVLLNIAAQFGDFFESALKRSVGVKDSGTILPGHGGILDRIDSVLFVLPAYFFIRMLCFSFAL